MIPFISNSRQKIKIQRLSVNSSSHSFLIKGFVLNLGFLAILSYEVLGEHRLPKSVDQVVRTSLSAVVKDSDYQLGLGSGLEYSGEDSEGYLFWAITDRGPNGKGPKIGRNSTAVFPLPSFQPRGVLIRLSKDFSKVSLVRELPFFFSDKTKPIPASGLIPQLPTRCESDVGVTKNLVPIPSSITGIDPEGITVAADGSLWIAEEYFPAIFKVNPLNGLITEQFKPESGLPKILNQRKNNRGFEGIAITPLGQNLFIAMQSPLLGQSNHALVRFNILSKESEMYFLPLMGRKKNESEDVKIGGLAAIDEDTFLAIKSLSEPKEAYLIRIDLKGATSISENNSSESNKTTKPTKVETLFSLRDLGWNFDKTEGLALLPDKRTIVLVADNDFGTELSLDISLEESRIDSGGDLIVPQPKIKVARRKLTTPIWTIKLKEPL